MPRPQGGRARRGRFNVRDVSRGYHETPRRWHHEELPKYLKTVELWRQLDPTAADMDGDDDIDIVLGSFIEGPGAVPTVLMQRWRDLERPLLYLENQLK